MVPSQKSSQEMIVKSGRTSSCPVALLGTELSAAFHLVRADPESKNSPLRERNRPNSEAISRRLWLQQDGWVRSKIRRLPKSIKLLLFTIKTQTFPSFVFLFRSSGVSDGDGSWTHLSALVPAVVRPTGHFDVGVDVRPAGVRADPAEGP